MLGKAMRFATVWILAFPICGKANRYKGAGGSEGTIEDLEHRSRQETNIEDHLSTISSCSRGWRLAVIAFAVTSADAFAPRNVQSLAVRPFQKDGNTAFAPILTNPNLATPQVSWHDMKWYAHRDVAMVPRLLGVEPLDSAGLEHPTPADVEAFRSLNIGTCCTTDVGCTILSSKEDAGPLLHQELLKPQFNVFQEYTGRLGMVANEFDLSPEEEAALWSYTNSDRDIINAIARGASGVGFIDCHSDQAIADDIECFLTKEDMLPWLKVLQAGLKKMPSAAAGRLYRGVGFSAEGTPGSMAPITGFSSFYDDFNVAKYFAEAKRQDGIQPMIFVMDTHSSGRILPPADILSPFWDENCHGHKAVVFRVGTKFVIEENEEVQQEVEALWRENLVSGTSRNWRPSSKRTWRENLVSETVFKKEAVPDFKVMVVKEVPTAFPRAQDVF